MLDEIVYIVKILFWVFVGAFLLKLIVEVIILDPIKKRKAEKEKQELSNELKKILCETIKEIEENNEEDK